MSDITTPQLTPEETERAARLHRDLVIWNSCDSSVAEFADEEYLAKVKKSGVTAINHTVVYTVDFQGAVANITKWQRLYESHPDVGFIAKNYADVARAKQENRAAVFMGFQDITALEGNLDNIEIFHTLGIRWIQPTYQDRNLAGDGCGERIQSGLSNFGLKLVAELDRLGIVADVSHVGIGTTLDVIEHSANPVMATHSAARGLVDTPRNKTDEEIKALAARGGVIGIAGKSGFLRTDGLEKGSTVDDLIDHVAYVADLVGIEHVSIGTDIGDERKYSYEEMKIFHAKHPEVAIIGDSLLVDRMHVKGLGPATLSIVTDGLVRRGFSDHEISLVLGENVNRVVSQIWD